MQNKSSQKIIAKNTILLYFRMMVTMVISLYTSRVILEVLGVDDFGIYQTVGGVVGLFSFLNNALAVGTSRFLTFELGTGNFEKLRKTFSTVLTSHIILAIGIVVLAETIGLWFVYHKLVIPEERMEAAVIAYHISVLTAVIQLTQVPYNASIISHEKMGIYAYASIIDAILKLLIVYLLSVGEYDKLVLYAILLCVVTIGIALYYRFYCICHFKETRYKVILEKSILKEVLGYSGWNLLSNISIALNNHGVIVLLNMFFNPGVVTGRAIANQVNMAAYHFITNFRTAVNPQIVKRYAAKDYVGSKELLLSSTKYSYYLMLMLALPIVFVAEPLLKVWLGQLPPYSVVFLQLAVITSLFQVFDTSFYTALYAKGQIRENALISPLVGFVEFPIIYILFNAGFSPVSLAWIYMLGYAVLGLIIKPILIIKIVDYEWREIVSVFIPCLKVTLASLPIPLLANYYLGFEHDSIIFHFISVVIISVLSVLCSCWFWGLNHELRQQLIHIVKKRFA